MPVGPSKSSVANVFRMLIAIVLVLLAAGVVGVAEVAGHVRTRIVEPGTTAQVADAVWQQPDLRESVAVESTDALMAQPQALKLLRSAMTAGGILGGTLADAIVRQRVLTIERAVLAMPQSRQLFVTIVTNAHANFVQQITTVPPDQLTARNLLIIDVRPFLPTVGQRLHLGSKWETQVPAGATVLHLTAASDNNLTGIRYLARFMQLPTWLPWLIAAILFVLGLVLMPWLWLGFATASVGLAVAAISATGLADALTSIHPTGAATTTVQLTQIIVDAFAADAIAVRNHLLVGAAACAVLALAANVIAYSRSRSAY